jgi:hypothetical protein
MLFEVHWSIDENEWVEIRRHAGDLDFERGSFARLAGLDGFVQFAFNGDVLFPITLLSAIADYEQRRATQGNWQLPWPCQQYLQGLMTSLIDLAYQLDLIIADPNNLEHVGDSDFYSEMDGSLVIWFTREPGAILISSDARGSGYDCQLEVPAVDFRAGVAAFLRQIATDIQMKAPEVLGWDVASGLRRYLASQ